MIRLAAVSLALLGGAGCLPGRSVLTVEVTSGRPIAGVSGLGLDVSLRGRRAQPLVATLPGGPLTLPPARTLNLVFHHALEGPIVVLVNALDSDNLILASGSGQMELAPGRRSSLTVFLDKPLPMGDAGANDGGWGDASGGPDQARNDWLISDLPNPSSDLSSQDLMTPDLAAPLDLAVARCSDRLRNGPETDVDCGGDCTPCGDGRQCFVASDCRSGVCAQNRCSVPSCADGVLNGDEIDVDCGGPTCPNGAIGKPCCPNKQCIPKNAAECVNGVCVACGQPGQFCCANEMCRSGCCAKTLCALGNAQTACALGAAQCGSCVGNATGAACVSINNVTKCGCYSQAHCPVGMACDSATGACTVRCDGNSPCNGGCCSAGINGTCQSGISNTACGENGAVCVNCGMRDGHICIAVQGGGRCGCNLLGDCSIVASACKNQRCEVSCDMQRPCQFGCCSNGQCAVGTANNACGGSGACLDCTAGTARRCRANQRCGCDLDTDCSVGHCNFVTHLCEV